MTNAIASCQGSALGSLLKHAEGGVREGIRFLAACKTVNP
jgi:hypothetical protein